MSGHWSSSPWDNEPWDNEPRYPDADKAMVVRVRPSGITEIGPAPHTRRRQIGHWLGRIAQWLLCGLLFAISLYFTWGLLVYGIGH